MSSRRDFLKGIGGIAVGFSLADGLLTPQLYAAPAPDHVNAWLHIAKDETVTLFTGKLDIGMGMETAIRQIVAEELDTDFAKVRLVMGDTALTPDQGGVGGSTTIASGMKPVTNAAATARLLLVEQASKQLGVPVERLSVSGGVVSGAGKSISYGALAMDNAFQEPLKVSGSGAGMNLQGRGKPKDPATYKIIGKSVPRADLPAKILGQATYIGDVRVDGMLHGRVIRPDSIGATLGKVDDTAAKAIPGFVQTVVKGNFVGVVGTTEWATIKAMRSLKVTWNPSTIELPQDLYQHMRSVTPKATREGLKTGDAAAATASAAKKLQAAYQWPYQAHASMGPGCAVADVRTDGVSTVWSGTQKPHALALGLADLLHVPAGQVRVIWTQDSGSYGRSGQEDTAGDAAVLSQAVGKPVRVQGMRSDMTQWGGRGPATVFDISGGLDASGSLTALQFESHGFSGIEVYHLATVGGNLLAGQLMGMPNTTGGDEFVQVSDSTPLYSIPNIHSVAHIVPAFVSVVSPLGCTHLWDPNGPAVNFALELFVDEAAAATGSDAVEYRLRHMKDPRAIAVLKAAAERFRWDARPSGTNANGTGRGVGVSVRGGTYVATVAEVEVNRQTGSVRVKRLVCAHDCGLIVNPDALRSTVAANLIQSMSRALKEEVTFSKKHVTSVDWTTYPIARIDDIPELDIVLMNHPDRPSTGAGEPSSRPTASAIVNAIFDATGARVRTVPFTPERVKAALV